MNPQKLQNSIVIVLYMVVTVVMTYAGLKMGLLPLMLAWALFPVLVYFTNRPDVMLCTAIVLFASQLKFPGVPGGLTLYYLMAFAFIVIAFLGRLINRRVLSDLKMGEVLVIAFILNVVIVIAARGMGFRALGDENWGGMRYVTLVIPAVFFLLIRFVSLTPKQWTTTFTWFILLSFLPFLGELLFVFSSGAIYFHYSFIAISELTIGTIYDFVGGENLLRFSSSSSAAQALMFYAVCCVRFRNSRKYLTVLLLLAAFAIASLSGHRLVLIRMMAFLWLFGLFYFKKGTKLKYTALSGVFLIVFVAFLYLFAPYMPQNAQRMVSFLPGIDIGIEARVDADVTVSWRIKVWLEAIKLIPEYFWMGRGYTFPQGVTDALMLGASGDYVYFWALETVAYHNGILSLLIGLGITGLLIGSSMILVICYRNYQRQQREWNQVSLKRIHNLFLINSIISILIFFTIYGDVHATFPGMFFHFIVLESLWFSDQKANKLVNNEGGKRKILAAR